MVRQRLTQLEEKKKPLLNWLELNCEDENILNSALEFFEFEAKVLEAILKSVALDKATANKKEVLDKSLSNVITQYHIDKIFNEDKARKWLINALILVVRDSNTFNGFCFESTNKTTLKTNILK